MTVIGCSCVITASVTAPDDCTTFPGSTSRSPNPPRNRRRNVAVPKLHLVELHRALVVFHRARSCSTIFSWSSSVCLGIAFRAHASR